MTKTNPIKKTALLLGAALAAVVLALAAAPSEAAFPGQNGKIVQYRNGDIWSMNADGTGSTQLTTNHNAESNPAVSPDGSRIAYEFFRGIWVMNADGSGKTMLTDGSTATDEDPAWSADGTRIAFSRGGADIWVMDADGSDPTNLTNTTSTNDDEVEPAWSPDGTRIAYTRIGCEPPNRGAHCVFAMNADGTGQTNLTPELSLPQCPNSPGYFHNGASRSPAWSPDGQKIAFSGAVICPNNMGSNIWVMNSDGSGKTSLINDNGTSDIRPVFSPDGTRIVFESNRDGIGSPTEIYSMPANGSGITRLTTNSVWDSDADWAPLDVTPPRVAGVKPAAGATGVSARASVTATFSEAMKANSLTRTTVKLVKKGTTKPVAASVTYDPDTMTVTLDPTNNLLSRTTYTATVTTGAQDAASNALPANKTWNFKVR